LSYCDWKETPLGELQAIPKDAKPITSWSDESEAYYNVIQNIKISVKTIQKRKEQSTRLQPTTSNAKPVSQNKNYIKFGKILKIALPVLIGIAAVLYWMNNQPTKNDKVTDTSITSAKQATRTPPQTQLNSDNDATAKEKTDFTQKVQRQKKQQEVEETTRQQTEQDKEDKYRYFFRKAQEFKRAGDYSTALDTFIKAMDYKNRYDEDAYIIVQEIQECKNIISKRGEAEKKRQEDEKREQQRLAEEQKQREQQAQQEKQNNYNRLVPEPIQELINDMVRVQGGTFEMGCTSEQQHCGDDEDKHTVTVSSFNIGKYEVTQDQWQAVMGSNPSHFKDCGSRCPVEQVSWDDVQGFITKLNRMTAKTFRLPTEAEWEYAARGRRTKDYKYAGSDDIESVAWYTKNSYDKGCRVT